MSVLIKVWFSDRIIKKLVAINISEEFAAKGENAIKAF